MARMSRIFSKSGRGGFRRPLIIGSVLTVAVVGVVAVSEFHQASLPVSKDARRPTIDGLPGGTQSNPQQDALAQVADNEEAAKAASQGRSFTPPLSAGRPAEAQEVGASVDTPAPTPEPRPVHAEMVPNRPPVAVNPRFAAPSQGASRGVDPKETKRYDDAIRHLLTNWDGRAPETQLAVATVVTPGAEAGDSRPPASARTSTSDEAAASVAARASEAGTRHTLIPAGRGVFAHTVVAVDSDTGGPIILQADSGPISGDRMIGTFSKSGGRENLLVVQVTKVVHSGEEITARGMVIAPSTMQTAVASSVDQHYLTRFLLPAAAAFVQGLGTALATTSNTYGQINPLGGTSYVTNLKLPQQLGVGAGAAAQRIGTALDQQAPTGPTIHLDANANVGVIFLNNVTTKSDAG